MLAGAVDRRGFTRTSGSHPRDCSSLGPISPGGVALATKIGESVERRSGLSLAINRRESVRSARLKLADPYWASRLAIPGGAVGFASHARARPFWKRPRTPSGGSPLGEKQHRAVKG